MFSVQDYLNGEEEVIDRFAPVYYHENETYCAVTNQRILFYKKKEKDSTFIPFNIIDTIKLETPWGGDLFYFMIVSLAMGSLWIAFGIASFIIPTLWTEVVQGILQGLILPGMGLVIFGLWATNKYWKSESPHLLLQTEQGIQKIYSSENILRQLQSVLIEVSSKKFGERGGAFSDLSEDQRRSEKILAQFEKVSVELKFKDENATERTLKADCNIVVRKSSIQLTAMNLTKFRNYPRYKTKINFDQIPLITEENVHRLLDFAQENQIHWYVLFDINFSLQRMWVVQSEEGILAPPDLFVRVNSPAGDLPLRFSKRHLLSGERTPEISELESLIREYGRKIPLANDNRP
ncbi:MAG: hypothetical protein ACTSRS_18260 [Candidatus Helarchaeota archaeon]